jgi:hypothetical protein
LARAYAMQGDTAKAKTAYQDFLTLWKDADPDSGRLRSSRHVGSCSQLLPGDSGVDDAQPKIYCLQTRVGSPRI